MSYSPFIKRISTEKMPSVEQISFIILTLVVVRIIYGIIRASRRSGSTPIHWQTWLSDFHYTSDAFYTKLSERIVAMNLPKVSTPVVSASTQDWTFTKRKYLVVERGGVRFDICAAPFGTTYFFSYWQTEQLSFFRIVMSRFPGTSYFSKLRSFYSHDTRSMFAAAIHDAIVQTIDEVTSEQNHRGLSEHARRPTMTDPYSR